MFVRKVPTLIDCPFTHKTDTAFLRFDSQNKLYRLELLKYGMSMHFSNQHSEHVDRCFCSTVICDQSEFIIKTMTCKNLLSFFKSQHVSLSYAHILNSYSEEFATENND